MEKQTNYIPDVPHEVGPVEVGPFTGMVTRLPLRKRPVWYRRPKVLWTIAALAAVAVVTIIAATVVSQNRKSQQEKEDDQPGHHGFETPTKRPSPYQSSIPFEFFNPNDKPSATGRQDYFDHVNYRDTKVLLGSLTLGNQWR